MKEIIELVYTDDYKRRCYPILAGLMVDYKEQVLITGIKTNMQYSICHIPPKERELVTRSLEPRTHQSTWNQLEWQRNNQQFSGTELQIAGCINKSALHETTSMSISMPYFYPTFCTSYIKAL